MAEFLIYNKDHWMDKLTEAEISAYVKKYPKFMDGYNARIQKGDPIEIREDGYWTGEKARNYRKDTFSVVTVPGLLLKDAERYTDSIYDYTKKDLVFNEVTDQHELIDRPKLIKTRKYNFGVVTDKTVFDKIKDVTITEKSIG